MGYAAHIGRVGALAVVLGIGVAVANTPGVAWAEPTDSGSSVESGESSGSRDESADKPAESDGESAAEPDAESADDPDDVDEDDSADEDSDVGEYVDMKVSAQTTSPTAVARPARRTATRGRSMPRSPVSIRLRSPSRRLRYYRKSERCNLSESVRKLRQRGSDSVRVGADVTEAQGSRGAAPPVSETSQVQRPVDAVAASTGKRAAAVTAAQTLVPVSAAQAAPVGKQAVAAVISEPPTPPPTPPTTAPDVVSGVLTVVGLSPLSGNGPGAPAESPASVALFAGWRRLSEQGSTDEASIARSQPVLTSQTEDESGLAFATATAALMSAPAVPTVGAPNLVTGTVSGSLNGYTVTGELASGKVAVDGVSEVGSKIIVRNWAELDAALGAANAGSTIHMRAGGYVRRMRS